MNRAERNARMIIAIKMMAEVIEDAKAEMHEEGIPLVDRELWSRCGMSSMTHDTQLLRFVEKQHVEFVETKTRIGSWTNPNVTVNPPQAG